MNKQPTETQKLIAEQTIYGDLKMQCDSSILTMYYSNIRMADIEDWKPILRPLSDLTREITHVGYNDNKPFVALVEIAKIRWPLRTMKGGYNLQMNTVQVQAKGLQAFVGTNIKEFNQRELDLLHLLHFDTRGLIESGDAIDVNTLSKNPYEV